MIFMVPSVSLAQGDEFDISLRQGFLDYLSSRSDCLAHYKFGSVQFSFDAREQKRQVWPGEAIAIQGTVLNTNNYPLPQGKILARVLRQDETVAAEQWYPYVAEEYLSGNYDLGANGNALFTWQWHLPAKAPAGTYRLEFYYLAGGRYVMAGIPYVPAVPGATLLFTVPEAGAPAAINFDRASATINTKPFALRAVPPTYPSHQPLAIKASLAAQGPSPIPVTLTAELHEWSDTDGEPALQASERTVIVTSQQPLPLTFNWADPKPGVYELIWKAAPQDPTILSSILKIRFPIEGNAPRIIFSGIGGYNETEATIVTCLVNGTYGAGEGSAITQINIAGQAIQPLQTRTDTGELTAASVNISRQQLNGATLEVATEAHNEAGEVTDTHTVTYNSKLFPAPAQPILPKQAWLKIVLIVVLAMAVLVGLFAWRQKRKPGHVL